MNESILLHWQDLSPSPLNKWVRGDIADDSPELQELAGSLAEHGLIQPLVIVATPDGPTPYQVIVGERRWRAARLLGEEAPLLPCLVHPPMAEVEQLLLMGVENLQRLDLDPIAEARYYDALRQRGLGLAEIIRCTGKTRTQIQARLDLLDLPGPVREQIAAGRLPISIAQYLRPLPADLQTEIAEKMAGRNGREIRQVIAQVQAARGRKMVRAQAGAPFTDHHRPPPPAVIMHGDLALAVRATCAACEVQQGMIHEIPWEQLEKAMNDQCDSCEVKGIELACQQCPLVDMLRALKKIMVNGEPAGPPHLYKLGIL